MIKSKSQSDFSNFLAKYFHLHFLIFVIIFIKISFNFNFPFLRLLLHFKTNTHLKHQIPHQNFNYSLSILLRYAIEFYLLLCQKMKLKKWSLPKEETGKPTLHG